MLMALSQWEGPFLLWVQEAVRLDWLDPLVSFYTHLGDHGALWIALCALLLAFPKTRRAGLTGAAALVCSLLLTNLLLKPLVARTRPWLLFSQLVPLVAEADPNSFPSGHTCASFSCAAAWWRTLPERWMRVAALLGAVAMGLSRLYVGVHFPSDVLCGALVGILCGYLGWQFVQTWEGRRLPAKS